jgi:GNAT superfamily N-acetyltransferase
MEIEYRKLTEPSDDELFEIGKGLRNHNLSKIEHQNTKSFAYIAKDENDVFIGGGYGTLLWDWFNLDMLFVSEDRRGKGVGHKILSLIEKEVVAIGGLGVYLQTTSFQSLGFYLKCGYSLIGEIKDRPIGHSTFFLNKRFTTEMEKR